MIFHSGRSNWSLVGETKDQILVNTVTGDLVRNMPPTSVAQAAGQIHTQSGPQDDESGSEKPLPMIQVGYLDEM